MLHRFTAGAASVALTLTAAIALTPTVAQAGPLSQQVTSLTAAAAGTVTSLSVTPSGITATVKPVAPANGTPTGKVTFAVDGTSVGAVALVSRTAHLAHVVATDKPHVVSATYAGDAAFTASSASTTRSNPSITARLSSAAAPINGWYRKPVKVTFACSKTIGLVTPCPKPVTITRQGGNRVTRTIRATDGGVATTNVDFLLDSAAPSADITKLRQGATYFDAPTPSCVGKDGVSGLATCTIRTERRGRTAYVTATATDVAGNSRADRLSYRLADHMIQGAKVKNGVYQIRHGKTYGIFVRGAQPRYVLAAPAPGRPHRRSVPFDAAGEGRWSIGIAMLKSRVHRWNLGYLQNGTLHVIKVNVV